MNVYERKTFIYELDTFPYGIYLFGMVWYVVVSSRKVPKVVFYGFWLVAWMDGWCYVCCVCGAKMFKNIMCGFGVYALILCFSVANE